MPTLIAIAFAGFIAQLVDGSLGMGYGVTSTSLLLTLGVAPALASASVHLAEIGTSGVSGFSHWRLGNVNGKVLLLIGVPGGIGAFTGAVVLSNLSLDAARPMVSLVLLVLGAVIIVKFLHGRRVAAAKASGLDDPVQIGASRSNGQRRLALIPLGLVGGFMDASGGGGWGPVTTSTLLAASRMQPRTIIGTVSGSEFIVSICASIGFLLALGSAGLDLGIVAMLLLGGVVAAPLSAWLVSRFDERALGAGVGGLIIVLNIDRALTLFDVDPSVGLGVRVATIVVSVVLVSWLFIRGRAARRAAAAV
ncbi:MAG TPA: sulfite exporter TauE/SafE family protein [Candidatus Binatia bacterium]|nr:sulfite exporter TauE/SafE family protein [Candidatus Binatia bacterium]